MQIKYPNTPGVKIKEVSLLPPSIAQVSTAIPVFLGYTEKKPDGDYYRITSLKEYEDNFGKGKKYGFAVSETNGIYTASNVAADIFLYEAIRLYFMNGGGDCYIISIGDNQTITAPALLDFTDNLPIVQTMDEPTLIVFPEAAGLILNEYGAVATAALNICVETKDKFTLIDSFKGANLANASKTDLTDLRGKISGGLNYGAAYFPPLETVIKVAYDEANISINSITIATIDPLQAAHQKALTAVANASNVTLPPSAAMAGVYAKVDGESGVWKAPANVALQGVIKPSIAISDKQQEKLNVDAGTGKSVNAIRDFSGKGTIVWGARTLAGNDNEWRYINVRRFFMTVEESVKKAAAQFVFENNDAKTWSKMNAMISAYLNGLWKDGALMGAASSEAYFVQAGLGTTMTTQDILEGRMIVRIGLAAVRPAEFIILEFSHFVNQ